jgi:Kef-type K+ transport system membrane component KefB
MNPLLTIGVILLAGGLFGELANMLKLPKVTGYIIAGIVLNLQFGETATGDIKTNTIIVTNISLAFITFSVGGTLLWKTVKSLGKTIVLITVFESYFAMIFVFAGFFLILHFFDLSSSISVAMIPVLGILLGALASPTDPSATLAVMHQYKARGPVSDSIMGIAAFDDVFGIINFSLGIAIAKLFISKSSIDYETAIFSPFMQITGGIILGIVFGVLFNLVTKILKHESDGGLIVSVFAFLAICFGAGTYLEVDELLATMTMGAVVVNFNIDHQRIFTLLERYTEELIFVLFFTISGMRLDFSVMDVALPLIVIFVILRAAGKFTGVQLGAVLSKADPKIRKYTGFGLFPQGGIVIGLTLILQSIDEFKPIADVVMAIVIGATVLHELFGPVFARIALKMANEIKN